MATTTNYGWDTPDDTDLVKDGASAIRTLGSSIDTTTKALNPSTTLGDIEYRSATANTNTRLGIGTSGQVLAVNGSGVPAWATASGWNPNFQLINAGGTNLTGAATITVSGISAKNALSIVIDGASAVNDSSWISVYFNNDTSAKYSAVGLYYTPSAFGGEVWNGLNADTNWQIAYTSSNATNTASGLVNVYGTNSAGVKTGNASMYVNGTGGYGHTLSTLYTGTSAISSVSIASSNGNFDAGKIYVYGA